MCALLTRIVVCIIGLNDTAHQGMANHIGTLQVRKRHIVDATQNPFDIGKTAAATHQVTLAQVAVITNLELKPRRVRNIFICSGVVFCASSSTTKASLSVRPRM
mgnify:CR=1 FL=1